MKLYSYIIVKDRGLAPNPFWGYCTLAVCTPNHMGIKPLKGDWIIGISPKDRENKLVYAMQADETLSFDNYFKDVRFQEKKPTMEGSWQKRCGDNFYEKDQKGEWIQHPNVYHNDQNSHLNQHAEVSQNTSYHLKKDTKHPFVFIAETFYYFGENADVLPEEFQSLILDRKGCKYDHAQNVVEKFLFWLKENHKPGIHGNPKDKEEVCSENCL